jgi:hypothetical protein
LTLINYNRYSCALFLFTMTDSNSSSVFYLLDFGARYTIDRCGSADTWQVSMMAMLTILTMAAWIAGIVMGFFRVEFYLRVAKSTLLLLTLVQTLLLFVFQVPPPVTGCGPAQSFPSTQVTISAYALSIFLSYSDVFVVHTYRLHTVMVLQLLCVQYSVLWLGFASAPSSLAAVVTGVTVAIVLHRSLITVYDEPGLVVLLSRLLGSQPDPPPAQTQCTCARGLSVN